MREKIFGIDQGQAVFNYDLESLQSDDYYEAESRFSETDGSSQDVSQQQYSGEMLSRSDSVMLERRVVAVIGEEHCSPCKRTFLMARNVFQLGLSCNIHVTDEEGKLVYQVDRWGVRPGQKRVIRDASGRILVRLNCKTHWKAEWVAYTDNDCETTEIFKVTPRPSVELRRKCKVCVTRSVAENLEKKIFEIKKNSCFARNYTVFHGETIIAEINNECSLWQTLHQKNNYSLITYPGVDTSFVVAIFVIVDVARSRAKTIGLFFSLLSFIVSLIPNILNYVAHANKQKHN